VLSILVAFIFVCIFMIFVYNQKTLQLYRLQHNFINNFTHELKTPITSLKLYLETFQKHQLAREDQLKYIAYMIQDVERLSDNVNQILDLGRIETIKHERELTTVDLVEATKNFLETNTHLFREANIKILNYQDKKFNFRINLGLFEMLLMNLLTNAIKYNQSTIPEIRILFKSQKHRLTIKFVDNGIGLEKSEIKKIFRKFYQVGQSDNMSAKGSGLGLYIVDSIVRNYKGRIKVDSGGKEKGSTFSVRLPLNPDLQTDQ
jgi:signal transduction histidine kinase